jgi:hypothetical protein
MGLHKNLSQTLKDQSKLASRLAHLGSVRVEQLEAKAYHFPMLPAPFSWEELHVVVFGPLK